MTNAAYSSRNYPRASVVCDLWDRAGCRSCCWHGTSIVVCVSTFVALFLAMLGTGLLLPIPEDAVAILAGATLAANAPVSTLVACVVGAWFGDALLFFAGRLCASSLDRLPRARHFFDPKKSARAQSMLDRWGDLAYVIARVVPGVRGAVFFGAGVFGRPARRFVLIDAVAALVHVPLLVLAGTALGPRVVAVAISLGRVGTAVVIAFAIVGVVLVSVSPKPSARTEPPD